MLHWPSQSSVSEVGFLSFQPRFWTLEWTRVTCLEIRFLFGLTSLCFDNDRWFLHRKSAFEPSPFLGFIFFFEFGSKIDSNKSSKSKVQTVTDRSTTFCASDVKKDFWSFWKFQKFQKSSISSTGNKPQRRNDFKVSFKNEIRFMILQNGISRLFKD